MQQQLDVYLEGVKREPPALYLADPIAANGTAVVPLVMERLRQQQPEYLTSDLIYLLSRGPTCYYVHIDDSSLSTLKNLVGSMQGGYRKPAEESLRKIESCRTPN
jgi:hypothetical protein